MPGRGTTRTHLLEVAIAVLFAFVVVVVYLLLLKIHFTLSKPT